MNIYKILTKSNLKYFNNKKFNKIKIKVMINIRIVFYLLKVNQE